MADTIKKESSCLPEELLKLMEESEDFESEYSLPWRMYSLAEMQVCNPDGTGVKNPVRIGQSVYIMTEDDESQQ